MQHHLSVHVQLPSWQHQLQLCQNDWHLLLQMLKARLTDALLSEDPSRSRYSKTAACCSTCMLPSKRYVPSGPASKRYSGFTAGAYYGWTASVPSQGIPSRVVHHPHEHLDFAVLWLTVLELLWLVAAMQRARQ